MSASGSVSVVVTATGSGSGGAVAAVGQADSTVLASARGVLLATAAVSLVCSVQAVGTVIVTAAPVFVEIEASGTTGIPVQLATGTVNVVASASATGQSLGRGQADVAVTASGVEADTVLIPATGTALAAVIVTAAGSFTGSTLASTTTITANASAYGTLLSKGTVTTAVTAAATGDDGIPDPTHGEATITISVMALGQLVAPAINPTPVPTAKSIDFRAIADYYNARSPKVPVYTFSSGRKFFESGS